ncbi:MAG: ABC transporter substrate-binding protein [Bdellovibrio sp.]
MSTFVITETGKYSSLDPLDGDSSQNLPVARMLYATPVEIYSDNTLGSNVLESFEYSRDSKTIKWVVREGSKFSDGTIISPEDVAFAVVRMAYSRPNFPLIKLISGLEKWLKSEKPLESFPEGIKISGQKITIKLEEDYPHPLFRFCLELFGVIPKRCVDKSTNKISCENLPTSGYYQLTENQGSNLVFKKRSEFTKIQGKMYPDIVKFHYSDADKILTDETLRSNKTVILSSESKLSGKQLKDVEAEFTVEYTPAAWFTILQINPSVKPFDNTICRQFFAKTFRKNFEQISGERSEASVFTKLVAGYKSTKDLEDGLNGKAANISDSCAGKFKGVKISWGYDKTSPETFVNSIKKTCDELGIQIDGPTLFKDRKEEVENFISGKSAFMYGRTGFWALDPTGDIQMLFTPNLHKGLQHFWSDDQLQQSLKMLVKNGDVNMRAIDDINQHLYSDSKFNVYAHIRRFYASKNGDLVKHLPIGITSPSPWHLFGDR